VATVRRRDTAAPVPNSRAESRDHHRGSARRRPLPPSRLGWPGPAVDPGRPRSDQLFVGSPASTCCRAPPRLGGGRVVVAPCAGLHRPALLPGSLRRPADEGPARRLTPLPGSRITRRGQAGPQLGRVGPADVRRGIGEMPSRVPRRSATGLCAEEPQQKDLLLPRRQGRSTRLSDSGTRRPPAHRPRLPSSRDRGARPRSPESGSPGTTWRGWPESGLQLHVLISSEGRRELANGRARPSRAGARSPIALVSESLQVRDPARARPTQPLVAG